MSVPELEDLAYTIVPLGIPGQQCVTLNSQNAAAPGTYTSYTNQLARRRKLTDTETLQNSAFLTKRTLIWEFWVEMLTNNCPLPKGGDQIIDSNGIVYIIISQPDMKNFFSDSANAPQLIQCLCQISVP